MNAEKLSKLQAQVRIGGKGTARRKKKIVHRTAMTDDKKLQSSLKKLSVNMIPGIEEVNMIKDDGTVIHFNNPKVQASLTANTFAISGQNETKQITEMLPGILNQLGADSLTHLRRLASNVQAVGHKRGAGPDATLAGSGVTEEEEVPVLVGNFDDPSKTEGVTIHTGSSELIIQEEVSPDSDKKESKDTEDKKGEGDKLEKKEKTENKEKKEERKEKREGKEDKKESKNSGI